jgi:hypothetical protein
MKHFATSLISRTSNGTEGSRKTRRQKYRQRIVNDSARGSDVTLPNHIRKGLFE